METKHLIRHLTSVVEPRKEILNIAYCRGMDEGEKIERWLNIEMLAKLLELKERNEVKQAEGEHQYDNPKRTTPRNYFELCDLWWKNSVEHWLEVKTLVYHHNYKKLTEHQTNEIEKDLDKTVSLVPPFIFHHLLFVFTDVRYKSQTWEDKLTSFYRNYGGLQKEDQWQIPIDEEHFVKIFLYSYVEEK